MQRISRLTILLLALLLLFCQACRRQTAAMPTDNIYHLETDYQDSYKGVNAVFYFADTPEGTAYNGFGRLYLLSGDSAMPQLCCFRPECRHASYADDCPASLFSLNDNGFQYMNGKFYYIAHTANKAQLCRMDVTGENHEILREEPGALLEGGSGLVFHRGFLYIYCVEELSEQSSALKLYQLDLENPASEMKLLWSENIPGLPGGTTCFSRIKITLCMPMQRQRPPSFTAWTCKPETCMTVFCRRARYPMNSPLWMTGSLYPS